MTGDWVNPFPMVAGWLFLVAGSVYAVQVLTALARRATDGDDGGADRT